MPELPTRVAALAAVISILCGLLSMSLAGRSTAPLGIRVPTDRVSAPAVRAATAGFVVGAVLSSLVGAGLAFALPAALIFIPAVVGLVGGVVALIVARRHIAVAKAAGGWFEGKQTRLIAGITTTRPAVALRSGRYVASFALVAIVLIVGALSYHSMPQRLPVHWNSLGAADSFAPKSVITAFIGPWVGLGVTASLLVLAYILRARGLRMQSEDGARFVERAAIEQWNTQGLLSATALLMTIGALSLSLITWFAPGHTAYIAGASGVTLAALLAAVLGYALISHRALAATFAESSVESPDDDDHWIAGIIYANRENSAAFVPKRLGMGWTVNFGRPIVVATTVVSVVLLLAAWVLVALVLR